MKIGKNIFTAVLAFLIIVSMTLAGCTPTPTIAPPFIPTRIPTATPIPLPSLTLEPGEFYFRLNNQPSFIYSRNIGGSQESYYVSFLDWSAAGGTSFVRLPLDAFGVGATSSGEIDEAWSNQWERIIDRAAVEGIYVLPILTGWGQWDPSYTIWPTNPLNAANDGPVEDPLDIFQPGSEAQDLWLAWVQTVVERWRGHTNILAWEIFGEINCSTAAEADGIALVNTTASRIRAADPGRLITASRCESGTWPDFYAQADIDFVEVHPYPATGQLDRNILYLVRQVRAIYHKPVLIGESGLHFARPDIDEGKITVAENAERGVRHAIWAGVVSGAMNGRALWWEDSVGIYFPELGMPWLEQYNTMELPAARFTRGVDFSGFAPLTASSSPVVWGAAVGNESMVLGWFRDAACEPPDWNLQLIPVGQTVTITIPGSAANWQVDFYDTKTGTTNLSSASVTRYGRTVTVTLPAFEDDIAFKMTAGAENSVITPEVFGNTNEIAGTWSGTITNGAGTFSTQIELSIQPDCEAGNVCGSFTTPQLPCSGDLFLNEITTAHFILFEQNVSGSAFCTSGGYETLQLLEDGALSYSYLSQSTGDTSTGILHRP
jgi:hypothetical protein